MDEELCGVGAFIDAWNREDRESGRTSADPIDQLGVFPALLDFAHPTLVQAGQRLCHYAARADRVSFPDPQVCSEIMGIPALTQRGRVRSDRVEQPTQLCPFGPGKRHERPW